MAANHLKLEATLIAAPDGSLVRRAAILAYDSPEHLHAVSFKRRLGWPPAEGQAPGYTALTRSELAFANDLLTDCVPAFLAMASRCVKRLKPLIPGHNDRISVDLALIFSRFWPTSGQMLPGSLSITLRGMETLGQLSLVEVDLRRGPDRNIVAQVSPAHRRWAIGLAEASHQAMASGAARILEPEAESFIADAVADLVYND